MVGYLFLIFFKGENLPPPRDSTKKIVIEKNPAVGNRIPREPILFSKPVQYEVALPPLPDLIKPRPIPYREPTYAEMKGYKDLSIPPAQPYFEVPVPPLVFETIPSKVETQKEQGRKELESEPIIPDINPSYSEKVNLYVSLFASQILECHSWYIIYVLSVQTLTRRDLSLLHISFEKRKRTQWVPSFGGPPRRSQQGFLGNVFLVC
jgi:hypothetical protein